MQTNDILLFFQYYYFIRLMGRKASHVALECTLQSHPNMVCWFSTSDCYLYCYVVIHWSDTLIERMSFFIIFFRLSLVRRWLLPSLLFLIWQNKFVMQFRPARSKVEIEFFVWIRITFFFANFVFFMYKFYWIPVVNTLYNKDYMLLIRKPKNAFFC